MKIDTFCEGKCDQCGQQRKGVRFSHGLSLAFLCWEHFRPLAAALGEHAASNAVCREDCHCDSCCDHCRARRRSGVRGESWCCSCPCCSRSRSYGGSVTSGGSVMDSCGGSACETRGFGRSTSHGEGRSPFA